MLSQPFRFYFANKGVQNQNSDFILYFIIISGLSLLSYIFFLRLQLYVTFIEVILNSIGLGFTIIEIGLSVWVFIVFYQRKRITWYCFLWSNLFQFIYLSKLFDHFSLTLIILFNMRRLISKASKLNFSTGKESIVPVDI